MCEDLYSLENDYRANNRPRFTAGRMKWTLLRSSHFSFLVWTHENCNDTIFQQYYYVKSTASRQVGKVGYDQLAVLEYNTEKWALQWPAHFDRYPSYVWVGNLNTICRLKSNSLSLKTCWRNFSSGCASMKRIKAYNMYQWKCNSPIRVYKKKKKKKKKKKVFNFK